MYVVLPFELLIVKNLPRVSRQDFVVKLDTKLIYCCHNEMFPKFENCVQKHRIDYAIWVPNIRLGPIHLQVEQLRIYMTLTCGSKLECALQSDICRCKLHVPAVQSHTENLKIIVKIRIKPFDHRECKVDNRSHFLVVACWFKIIGEVEVELAHIEADWIMHEVLVREI